MPKKKSASCIRVCVPFAFALRASVLALALAGLPGANAAELRAANRPDALISAPGKTVALQFQTGVVDSPGVTLRLTLFPYDDEGRLSTRPAASYRTMVGAAAQGKTVQVNITPPGPGLYRVDAELVAQDGDASGRTSVNMAVVMPRDSVGPSDFGVVTHFVQGQGSPQVVLPLVKQAGFSWIRDELYWQEIEKTPGRFTFPARYDDYVARASQLGLSVLGVLDYGNAGVYPDLFNGSTFPMTPQARALFVRYVDAVVRHYGKTITHWEIWNEPDFNRIGYDRYLALLKDAYHKIKQINPNATVISCGGGGSGGGPGADCMVALMKRGGLNDQDGFSVHPYMTPNTPEKGYAAQGAPIPSVSIPSTWPYLKRFATDNIKADGRPLQVWITELGWPVNPKVPGQDETSQAANVTRSYLLSRRYDSVRVLFWYDFIDDGTDPNNFEHNFGLLHHDLSPKPAFVATSVLATTLGNRRWQSALVDTDDVKAYRYGTQGGDSIIAGWTVGTDERTVSLKLPPGSYVERDWQGAQRTVTVSDEAFTWRVGPLPRYLIPAAQTASQ
ncbi:cellulase family glycosylhydrolase [Paraburkholderia sp. A1RI_3L]|uniref:beta-glucosidase n=1 Tax=Paraburkholderia TaxID=1822464 RepID=UPI003B7E6399